VEHPGGVPERLTGGRAVIVVFGESIVDMIAPDGGWSFRAHPGGSPLNVAVALARLGEPVSFASQVGDDLFGPLLAGYLVDNGVDVAHLRRGGQPTNVAFVRLDPDGAARYDFRLTWDRLPAPVPVQALGWLHVGSLACTVEPGRVDVLDAVHRARAAGVPVSYDPNVRPMLARDKASTVAVVEEFVALADLVKASEEDLAWLYPDTPAVDAARAWLALGTCRLAVVTRGGDGAVAVHQGGEAREPAPKVTVEDTVGAGDAFTAGLLSAVVGQFRSTPTAEEAVVRSALRFANATAAIVCGRRGADPPTRAEVTAFLATTT
jgi:fructokinase